MWCSRFGWRRRLRLGSSPAGQTRSPSCLKNAHLRAGVAKIRSLSYAQLNSDHSLSQEHMRGMARLSVGRAKGESGALPHLLRDHPAGFGWTQQTNPAGCVDSTPFTTRWHGTSALATTGTMSRAPLLRFMSAPIQSPHLPLPVATPMVSVSSPSVGLRRFCRRPALTGKVQCSVDAFAYGGTLNITISRCNAS